MTAVPVRLRSPLPRQQRLDRGVDPLPQLRDHAREHVRRVRDDAVRAVHDARVRAALDVLLAVRLDGCGCSGVVAETCGSRRESRHPSPRRTSRWSRTGSATGSVIRTQESGSRQHPPPGRVGRVAFFGNRLAGGRDNDAIPGNIGVLVTGGVENTSFFGNLFRRFRVGIRIEQPADRFYVGPNGFFETPVEVEYPVKQVVQVERPTYPAGWHDIEVEKPGPTPAAQLAALVGAARSL